MYKVHHALLARDTPFTDEHFMRNAKDVEFAEDGCFEIHGIDEDTFEGFLSWLYASNFDRDISLLGYIRMWEFAAKYNVHGFRTQVVFSFEQAIRRHSLSVRAILDLAENMNILYRTYGAQAKPLSLVAARAVAGFIDRALGTPNFDQLLVGGGGFVVDLVEALVGRLPADPFTD